MRWLSSSYEITIELAAGGLVRARAGVINIGGDPYTINDCVIAFPIPQVAREILDLAGHWGKERIPQRRPLTVGVHLREGRKGRTGPDAATCCTSGLRGSLSPTGEIWAVHTGWSGNHTHYAERISTGEQVIGGGELLLPGEVILQPARAYATPWVYGCVRRGLDDVAAVPPLPPCTARAILRQRPVTLNVWEAVYFNHDLDQLVELAEVPRPSAWSAMCSTTAGSAPGATIAPGSATGRSRPRSGRTAAPAGRQGDRARHGVRALVRARDDQHRLRLRARHPEWMMATGGRLPVESRSQQVINLGIPECYAYIRDAIFAILAEYQISYIKWDHNRDLIDAGTAPDGRPGVHEQTLAFYRLVDEIKAAHPGLEIESCSSGGARVDLGVLERTDRVWVADCIDPLERQQMNRWTTQLIPPELMGSHIASGRSHTTGRRTRSGLPRRHRDLRSPWHRMGPLGCNVQELADLTS